jgi:hypothetical protein
MKQIKVVAVYDTWHMHPNDAKLPDSVIVQLEPAYVDIYVDGLFVHTCKSLDWPLIEAEGYVQAVKDIAGGEVFVVYTTRVDRENNIG